MPVVIRALFACELLLGALYAADWAAGRPSWMLTHLVDLDGEGNLPAWFSSMQLLALAMLLALLAGPVTAWRERRLWPVLALAAVALTLSCDEVAQIHEWVSHRSDALLPGGVRSGLVRVTGAWMFLLVPPVAFVVMRLWRTVRWVADGHPDLARRYRFGFLLYLFAVAGLELLVNATRGYPALMATEVLFEELSEMAAVTLLLWATVDLLTARGVRVLFATPFAEAVRKAS
jgi:hypothetical protein